MDYTCNINYQISLKPNHFKYSPELMVVVTALVGGCSCWVVFMLNSMQNKERSLLIISLTSAMGFTAYHLMWAWMNFGLSIMTFYGLATHLNLSSDLSRNTTSNSWLLLVARKPLVEKICVHWAEGFRILFWNARFRVNRLELVMHSLEMYLIYVFFC